MHHASDCLLCVQFLPQAGAWQRGRLCRTKHLDAHYITQMYGGCN